MKTRSLQTLCGYAPNVIGTNITIYQAQSPGQCTYPLITRSLGFLGVKSADNMNLVSHEPKM